MPPAAASIRPISWCDGSRYTIEDRGSERVLRVGGREHPTYYTERLKQGAGQFRDAALDTVR